MQLRRSIWFSVTAIALFAAIAPPALRVAAGPSRRAEAELELDRLRITVYSGRGEFMLWHLDADDDWIPLLFPGDPSSTVMTVRDGTRAVVLRGSARMRLEETRRHDHAILQRFIGSELEIEREFSALRARGADQVERVRIALRLYNHSGEPRELGLRLLLDTHLGESAPREYGHFQLERGLSVPYETELHPRRDSVRYWLTRDPDRPEVALQQMLLGREVTAPDRLLFANWRRLYRNPWDYTVLPSRRFNDPPYSLNDSAVAVYYDPVPVDPGTHREIVIVLGPYAPAGYYDPEHPERPVPQPSDLPGPATAETLDQMSPDRRAEYVRLLRRLDALIRELDEEVKQPGQLTERRLQELRGRLDELLGTQ